MSSTNIHRGRPGFPVICWRKENSLKSVDLTIGKNVNTELETCGGEEKMISTEKTLELNDKDIIETNIEIEKGFHEKISENQENLYHRKTLTILPDNCGTIFSIEASVSGASF